MEEDRIYKVFVSSTYEDLKEERYEIMQALLKLNCLPKSMELFPATSGTQWNYIMREIDNSDFYIVIVKGRYGSLADGGISFTEREYDYAVIRRKPILCFIYETPSALPMGLCESDNVTREKLNHFKEKLMKNKLCSCTQWKTAKEIAGEVYHSVNDLKNRYQSTGYVRIDSFDPNKAAEFCLTNHPFTLHFTEMSIDYDSCDDDDGGYITMVSYISSSLNIELRDWFIDNGKYFSEPQYIYNRLMESFKGNHCESVDEADAEDIALYYAQCGFLEKYQSHQWILTDSGKRFLSNIKAID